MTIRSRYLYVTFFMFAMCYLGCKETVSNTPKDAKTSPVKIVSKKVKTTKAQTKTVERVIYALGTLLPFENTTLSAKVSGRLSEIKVDIQSFVNKGDIIAQVEKQDYELALQQAKTALIQARVRLGIPIESSLDKANDEIAIDKTSVVKQSIAVLQQAKANRDRLYQLVQDKIVPSAQMETAQSEYEVAVSGLQNAYEEARNRQATVYVRRAELQIIEQQLRDTATFAPFAGVIAERKASVGQYCSVGSAIVNLMALDPLRLRLEIPERDSVLLRSGQLVKFSLENDNNLYQGKIQRISPYLNQETRMLTVEADIKNNGNLRPGFLVKAQIIIENSAEILTLPPTSIVKFIGLEKIFTIRNGKAIEKSVVTGLRGEDWLEVQGIDASMAIIADAEGLFSGQPVEE